MDTVLKNPSSLLKFQHQQMCYQCNGSITTAIFSKMMLASIDLVNLTVADWFSGNRLVYGHLPVKLSLEMELHENDDLLDTAVMSLGVLTKLHYVKPG